MFPCKIDDEIELSLPDIDHDAKALFNLIDQDRNRIMKWLPWVKHMQTVKDEQIFLSNSLIDYQNNKSLIVVIKYHGDIAGTISFNGFDENRHTADIGYWLGKDFTGYGIIHRCVIGMLDIGFNHYDLNKIIINAAVENNASNNVAKKCNFHLDGVLRENELLLDGFHDENTWSLLLKEKIHNDFHSNKI
ncbi:GNAT family N-acetyltransferase [Apilactobacillus apisilvae]|uniref:GNAT family N-acetyltransferase n=1 Tax=Apilactobacillus apisilvae TaxID=2923364 RepID=A0ABY4PHN3_9LACO|nr:GNAT family protein [Apilactobacillus apisilvae]UQS84927.1 GNAT family N-acetyltransferase [Apilactobacillus apisilvae]